MVAFCTFYSFAHWRHSFSNVFRFDIGIDLRASKLDNTRETREHMCYRNDTRAIRMSERSCERFSRSTDQRRINILSRALRTQEQYNTRNIRKNTWTWNMNEHSVTRMNEYMRTAWSSWASGPLDILFVIVVACVALLNLCVIRCSKLRIGIWRFTFSFLWTSGLYFAIFGF